MIKVNRPALAKVVQDLKDSSQDDYVYLAKEIGSSAAVLCRCANQTQQPRIETVSKIADYLKIDPLTLLETSDEYLNLTRLPKGKREAIQAILNGK